MDHNTRAASSFMAVESSFHKELQMEQKLGIIEDKVIKVPSLLVRSLPLRRALRAVFTSKVGVHRHSVSQFKEMIQYCHYCRKSIASAGHIRFASSYIFK